MLISALLAYITMNVQAVIIIEGNPSEPINEQEKFPDVCLIERESDSSHGSGVFLSENIILTARHVVDENFNLQKKAESDAQMNAKNIKVLIADKELSVGKIESNQPL